MTGSNRFYENDFQPAVGSNARSHALRQQFQKLQQAFDLMQSQLDLIAGINGITSLTGFPSSFVGAGDAELRVNTGESAVAFVRPGNMRVKSFGGTSYTVLTSDAGCLLVSSNAAPVTITVPADALGQGDVVCICQGAGGQITLSPGSGVSFTSSDDLLATRGQGAQIAIVAHDGTRGASDAALFGVIGDRYVSAPVLSILQAGDGANNVGWDGLSEPVPDTVADIVETLQGFAHSVNGTANQIAIAADGAGNLTLSAPQDIGTSSDPTFRDLTVRHLLGGAAPNVASVGTGAGTGPTYSVAAGDGLIFRFDMTTGTTPAASSPIATFAFQQVFANTPLVIVLPANGRTAALQSAAASACGVGVASNTGFQLTANLSALAASSQYSWFFIVHGS